jgi:hypothetical protein
MPLSPEYRTGISRFEYGTGKKWTEPLGIRTFRGETWGRGIYCLKNVNFNMH